MAARLFEIMHIHSNSVDVGLLLVVLTHQLLVLFRQQLRLLLNLFEALLHPTTAELQPLVLHLN